MSPSQILKNRDWLFNEYIIRKKSALIISAELGCDNAYVCRWLKAHNIPRRSTGEARKLQVYKYTPANLERMRRLHEAKRGIAVNDSVREKIKKSMKYFLAHNPEALQLLKDRGKMVPIGKKNKNWRGGTTYGRMKTKLFKMRGHGCQYTNCSWSVILDIHHLDSNRKNNDPSNLVILCPNHHKAITWKKIQLKYSPTDFLEERKALGLF